MPNKEPQLHNLPLTTRDAALRVLVALFAGAALIGAVALLALGASSASAGGGGVTSGGDDDGGGGGGGGYVFPIPGPHTYGDGWGAGRGHQGQDVFARCGRRLVAVRAGKVQKVGRGSSAGNYIVIDGRNTGMDFVYMHMKRPAIPRQGARVRKGQKIGLVGETGNAVGCHVHFEKWSAPGYYQGGSPRASVTRSLRKWDRYS